MPNKNEEKLFCWSEIYEHWHVRCYLDFPKLEKAVSVRTIEIKKNNNQHRYIAGYDWVANEDLNDRISYVTDCTDEFLMFGPILHMGTIHTARMLAKAADDKEMLAAIWISAFVKEIERIVPDSWRGIGFQLISNVAYECRSIICDKSEYWHQSMKYWLPEYIFSKDLLDSIKNVNLDNLIELAAINCAYILNSYSILYYLSDNALEDKRQG